MVECEVSFVVQDSSVVQRGAVVELVKGYDIVGIRVGQGQMSYKPACAVVVRIYCGHLGVLYLHKASTACNHNILHIWQWFELCGSNQHWRLLPHTEVFKKAVWPG